MTSSLRTRLHQLFSWLGGNKKKSTPRSRRVRWEQLERRELMAIDLDIVEDSMYVSNIETISNNAVNLTYHLAVTNNGDTRYDATSQPTTLAAFLSNGTENAGFTEFSLVHSLNPGEKAFITQTSSTSNSSGATITSHRFLRIVVDIDNSVSESVETNNSGLLRTIDAPDLIATTFKITNVATNSLTYSYTIKNQGVQPINLSQVFTNDETKATIKIGFGPTPEHLNTILPGASENEMQGILPTLAPGGTFSGTMTIARPINRTTMQFIDFTENPYATIDVNYDSVSIEQNINNNDRSVVIYSPDMQVTALNVTSFSANSLSYSASVKNTGTAKVEPGTYYYRAYLSSDKFIDGNDVELLPSNAQARSFTVGSNGLTVGSTQTISVSQVPATINTAARPYLLFKVDADGTTARNNLIPESLEQNNTASATIDTRPDLQVTSALVNSVSANTISYTYTLRNNGLTPANLGTANLTMQGFLSADATFNNAGDVALGQTALGTGLPVLQPGTSITRTLTQTLANGAINRNTHPQLALKIDGQGVIAESNEGNNTLAVLINRPDLIVSGLQVTNVTTNSISYRYTLKNNSPVSIDLNGATGFNGDNVAIRAALSNDTVFNNLGDSLLPAVKLLDFPSNLRLSPGQTYTGTATQATTVNPQTYANLIARVDSANQIAESSETNNDRSVKVLLNDLIVNNITITTTPVPNSSNVTLAIAPQLKNQGTAAVNLNGATANSSDNVQMKVYLSSDPFISLNDSLIVTQTLGTNIAADNITAGSNSTLASLSRLVTAQDLSSHPYVIVQIDSSSVVLEANESNNMLAQRIVPLPDLTVSALKVTAYSSTAISYDVTITNTGTAPLDMRGVDGNSTTLTDNLTLQAYLASGETLSSTKLFAGQKGITQFVNGGQVGILNPGASFTASYTQTFNQPTFNVANFPNLIVTIDTPAKFVEVFENNNTRSTPVVKPDLEFLSVIVDSTTSTSINYTVEIQNTGTGNINLNGATAADTDDAEIKVYLSHDAVFNVATDFEATAFLVPLNLPILAPGEFVSLSISSPLTVDPTTFSHIFVFIDWSNVLPESNEENNFGVTTIVGGLA
jgi:CARDB